MQMYKKIHCVRQLCSKNSLLDTLKIMKLTTLLLSCSVFSATASVYAQDERVTVNISNQPLSSLVSVIKQQTNYSFFFNTDEVDLSRKVSISARDIKVKDALRQVLAPQGLASEMSGNHILIMKKNTSAVKQQRVIHGIVKDSSGAPIVGATVSLKGTSSSVSTDASGNFRLQVTTENPVLVVSFLGMLPTEVALANQSTVEVVLQSSSTAMDEVVVTALGIKKEAKSLSYHVQQISADEVTKVPDANFVNSLNGKVAGVTINSASSGIGGAARVVMRGTKSISGSNNALYVIDGVPMFNVERGNLGDKFSGAGQTGDALSTINPDDIESISVLSGASAAALYGSAAANGVVMVTTKRGKEGKTSINLSNSTTFSDPLVLPDFQQEYGISSVGDFYSWGDKLAVRSSYSPRDFFQTGSSVMNSVNLSTGTSKNQTRVSLGHTLAGGIIRNNDFNKINFSLRNTTKFLEEKLELDVQAAISRIKEQNMLAQGEYHNPILPVYLFPAGDDFNRIKAFERYNPERNFPTQFWPYDDGMGLQNPYWVTDREVFGNTKTRYTTSASLKYAFDPGINLSGRFKLDQSNEDFQRKFNASTSTLFASETGFYALDANKSRQMYAEVLLNVDRNFWQDNFNIVANIGASIDDTHFDQNMYGGKLAMVPNLFTYSNIARSTSEALQTAYIKQRQSIFASAQLGYKGLVYLDVSARNDWPSTLANTSTSSFFYPSIGLSGIITDLFKIKSDILPYLKIRASYSEVGNEPAYQIAIPTYLVANGVPSTQTRLHNPYLKPERTKASEIGANFGLFRNKLKIDATLYKSSTYNQIFDVPLSSSSGYTSLYLNAGQIDNKGIELSARYGNQWGKFSWSTYGTYSLNRNKVVQLIDETTKNPVTGDDINLPTFDMAGTGNYKISLREGGSMGDIYVTSMRTDEHGAIYVDPLSNTVIAESNKFIYAGNAAPKFNAGWGNTFGWNGISLGFLATARFGGVGVSNTQALLDYYGVSQTSAQARDEGGALVNGYRIPAKEYYQTIGAPNGGAGSMYVYSATNIRLSELTLGYDVPVSKWTNAVKGLNVSLIGRNLFFLYRKAPYDPELTASTGTYFQGIDYFMQPSLRHLGFSVKLQF